MSNQLNINISLPEKRRSGQLVKRLSGDGKISRSKSLSMRVETPRLKIQPPGSFKDEKYELKITTSPIQQINNFHSGMIWNYSVNSEQNLLATGGKDGKIYIWEIQNGEMKKESKFIFSKHSGEILSLTFLENNLMCSSSSEKELIIWNYQNGNEIKRIEISDSCLCMTYNKNNKRLVIGLINGEIQCYLIDNKNKFEMIQKYEVHCAVTAIDMYYHEEESTMYFVGTLEGTFFILYDYEDKMQLVKTHSFKEETMISSIIANGKEKICYVTYSNNKIVIFTIPDCGFVVRYKGMITNCSVIRPCLSDDKSLLLIGSKDNGIYVFPNIPTLGKKIVEIIGVKCNLFVTDKKPVIHCIPLPGSSNILLIDSEGCASVFSLKY